MKAIVSGSKIYAVEKSENVDYNEQSTLINANGVVTSSTGGNGWVIYQQDQYNEFHLALNTAINPSFPRWQTISYPATAYFKTPSKGILTHYTSKQTVDGNIASRVCTHWILKGYESEENCLAGIGGVVLDDYIVPSISIGSTVTRNLSNTKPFQYYSLTMVNNHGKDGSYTSMGETRFYMRTYNPHTVKKVFMVR